MNEWMDGWMDDFYGWLILAIWKGSSRCGKLGRKVNVIENVPCIIDQDYQR